MKRGPDKQSERRLMNISANGVSAAFNAWTASLQVRLLGGLLRLCDWIAGGNHRKKANVRVRVPFSSPRLAL